MKIPMTICVTPMIIAIFILILLMYTSSFKETYHFGSIPQG